MAVARPPSPEPQRNSLQAVGSATFIAALLVIVIALTAGNYRNEAGMPSDSLGGDFLQDWIGGYIIAAGNPESLYDRRVTDRLQHDAQLTGFTWPESEYFPMVYPPAWYAAVSPLSKLSYRTACFTWLAILGLTIPAIAFILSRCLRLETTTVIGITLGLVCFPPVIQSLVMGQKSMLWLCVWVGVFALCRQGRERSAGVLFGLMLMKPIMVPVLIGLMIAHRRWTFVLASALSATAIASASLLLVPLRAWFDYAGVVAGVGSYHETSGYSLQLAQNLGALMLPITSGHKAVYWVMFAAMAGLVVALIARTAGTAQSGSDRPLDDRFWIAAVLGTILLSPHYFAYDLTLLGLLPIAMACCGRLPDAAPWIAACFAATAANELIVQTFGFPPMPLVLIAMLAWHGRREMMLVADCRVPR